jgi:stage III sporulation protein AA
LFYTCPFNHSIKYQKISGRMSIKMDVNIIRHFNPQIRSILSAISAENCSRIQEIRLRLNKPISVTLNDTIKTADKNGQLVGYCDNSYIVTEQDINDSFNSICQYSVHSFQKEITGGFVTVQGGHRAGICGTAVVKNGQLETIKHISSINFRIARQVFGAADEIMNSVFSAGADGLLIAGPPSSGKTTVLRDLCRQLGKKYKLSLIDERGEIAAVYHGISQNDVGIYTDVFDGYCKADGIETAVRVMSPDIIVCDEIGCENDISAIKHAMNCGVKIIAAVHAGNLEELKCRKHIMLLIKNGAFRNIAVLSGAGKRIQTVRTDEFDKTDRSAADTDNNGHNRLLYVGRT